MASARLVAGGKIAVLLAELYVTCPDTVAPFGPTNVNVVASIVDGFIALLKVAVTMVLGHAPLAPLGGATEMTVGGFRLELPFLSGSLQPVVTMSSKNAINHIY